MIKFERKINWRATLKICKGWLWNLKRKKKKLKEKKNNLHHKPNIFVPHVCPGIKAISWRLNFAVKVGVWSSNKNHKRTCPHSHAQLSFSNETIFYAIFNDKTKDKLKWQKHPRPKAKTIFIQEFCGNFTMQKK